MAFANHSHIGKKTFVDLSIKYLDWWFTALIIYQNHLEELKKHWRLHPTLRDSDVIGLECGLAIESFKSSPGDLNIQQSLRTVDETSVFQTWTR